MWTTESRSVVGDYGAGQALTDEQYARIAPALPPAKRGGRPRTTELRRVLDALFSRISQMDWRSANAVHRFRLQYQALTVDQVAES